MAKGQNRWYPLPTEQTEFWMKTALRRIYDMAYQTRDEMGPHCQFIRGDNKLTTTNTAATVPGLKITFDRAGQWLVTANVCLTLTSASGKTFSLTFTSQAGDEKPVIYLRGNGVDLQTHMIGQWLVTVDKDDSYWVQIVQDTAGGTSEVDGANSTLSAVWQGITE